MGVDVRGETIKKSVVVANTCVSLGRGAFENPPCLRCRVRHYDGSTVLL